ncbi:conserved hypothetical protein [Ricinus communis]|uniref:Uncharacterized protein n=1 Tax=Ricinus communis TaxID=3988 RepID=B9RL81_RICCO|nr:conserved hypothetical protein [Ricinus communis]
MESNVEVARQNVKDYWTKNSAKVQSNDIREQVITGEGEIVDDEDEFRGHSDGYDYASSHYFDSDDLGSHCSKSDDRCADDAFRRPSTKMRFDVNTAIPMFCLNMVFNDVNQFRHAIAKYAAIGHQNY